LPDIFDSPRITPDQQRNDVVGEIAGNGKLTSIQRGIPKTVDAVFGCNLERDEIASGTADNHFGVSNSHSRFISLVTPILLRRVSAATSQEW
jgi:hypothetical protein